MKKRFLPVFLSLALALALAAPAFATGGYTLTPEFVNAITGRTGSIHDHEISISDAYSLDSSVYPEAESAPGRYRIGYLGIFHNDFLYDNPWLFSGYVLPSDAAITFHVEQDWKIGFTGYTLREPVMHSTGDGWGKDELLMLMVDSHGGSTEALTAGDYTMTLAQIREYVPEFDVLEIQMFYDTYLVVFLDDSVSAAPSAPAFTDVPDWCAPAVDWAVSQNITQGMGDNKFEPGTQCTNSMILTFLWRAEGEPAASVKAPVTVASYYQDAINWAYEKGMIDASFNPDAPCTRATAVNYIWQAFDKPAASAGGFIDVPANADYAPAASWAAANGIAMGYGNNDFQPGNVCTRGEIVTFLHRAYVPSARLK